MKSQERSTSRHTRLLPRGAARAAGAFAAAIFVSALSVAAPAVAAEAEGSAATDSAVDETAAEGQAASSGTLGALPYRGWSSWGQQTVNDIMDQQTIREQSDALAASGLMDYGFDYINMDGGWHDKGGTATFDANGRPIATTAAFSDFPGTVQYIHDNGQKAGLYTVPGVSTGAYDADYPILGTEYTVRDIIVDESVGGNTGIGFGWWSYKIDYDKPGAQEYIDSIVALWASWGIDFIKLDFVGPSSENGIEVNNRDDVEAWNKAIENSGRDIWLELSVALGKEGVETWQKYANGWRIDQDVECGCKTVGEWTRLLTRFYDLVEWQNVSGPEHGWNDLDGAPVGDTLGSGLTFEEQRTALTLWSMANSPLYLSGDLADIDPEVMELLTNEAVLDVQSSGKPAVQVIGGETPVWASPKLDDGSYYVSVFNLHAAPSSVEVPWSLVGFNGASSVTDLWSGEAVSGAEAAFSDVIPGHGARLFKVVPTGGKADAQPVQHFEAEDATLAGSVSVEDCSECSGGAKLVSLGGADTSATFSNIKVDRAGTYLLGIDYLTIQNRAFQFSVNGGPLQTLTVGGTTLNLPSTTTVPITLKAGTNEIRFSNTAAIIVPDLDRISIIGDGTLAAPAAQSYEAENASFTGAVGAVARPSASIYNWDHWRWRYLSNSAGAGPVTGPGDSITFSNVVAAEAGTYNVEVAHTAFTSRPLTMTVNEQDGVALDLRGNDKWDTAASTVVQVELQAGANTIAFTNPAGGVDEGAFLDRIVVSPVVGDAGLACIAGTHVPYWAYGVGLCEWTYTGTWQENRESLDPERPYGVATPYVRSTSAATTAQISFTNATGVKLYAITDSGSGIASVAIDGTHVADINLYSASKQLAEVFQSAPLTAAGTHTLTVTVTGDRDPNSTGSSIALAEVWLSDEIVAGEAAAAGPGIPGTSVDVTGTAWAAGAELQLQLQDASGAPVGEPVSVTVGADGTFTGQVAVPAGTAAGAFTIAVSDGAASVTVDLTVIDPSITLDQATIVRGTDSDTLVVSGTDWEPGVVVSLEAHSDPVTLGDVTPGEDGSFSLEADTSALEVGEHTVFANQTRSDGRVIERQVALSIRAAGSSAEPTTPVASGDPTPTTPATPGGSALPSTGVGDMSGLALLAGLLLVAGVVVVAVRRRRRLDAE